MEINKMLKFQEQNISVFGTNDKPMFIGSQIGTALGYTLGRKAVIDHVWDENKMTVQQYRQLHPDFKTTLQSNVTLINESGVYQLIFKSQLESAKAFQQWVFSMLSEMRKTGVVTMTPKHNQMVIMNEEQLHKKVIDFIRKQYPDALVNASLGENQNTDKLRLDSYYKGYQKGHFDITIYNQNVNHPGMMIEFKNPAGTGVLSIAQQTFKKKMEALKWKCLVSDNYDEIIVQIIKYFNDERIPCSHCKMCFKTKQSLEKHLSCFHKIDI